MCFSVLFVCTGNICRSPMAERLLRAWLDPVAPVVASSAGTAGVTGYPMDNPSAVALRELGGDPRGHIARRLTRVMIIESDLILTGESSHRSTVLQADPMAFRRVFTLREFARLGAGLGPLAAPVTVTDLRERVSDVAERRGHSDFAPPGADEIGDPFGAPMQVVRGCAAQIAAAVDGIIAALGFP